MPARRAARGGPREPMRIRPPGGGPGLEDLLLRGSSDAGLARSLIVHGLDHILESPAEMDRVLAYKPGGFEHIFAGFAAEMAADSSRPVIHDCAGPEARRLLLLILLHLRGVPVLGGVAAVFGVDARAAPGYLGYGMAACRRSVETPEKISARITGMLDRGEYDGLERDAPDLHLFIERTELDSLEADGSHAGQQELLVFCTARGRALAVHEVPPDAASPLEALARYAYGEGGFLRGLLRPLPDGRRWMLTPDGCLRGGLEGFSRRERGPGHGGDSRNVLQLMLGLTNSYVDWEEAAGEVPWSPNYVQGRQ